MYSSPEENNIGYVVRSPAFPKPIEAPLNELESTGDLIPFVSADVRNFQGNRIEQNWIGVPVVIIKMKHSVCEKGQMVKVHSYRSATIGSTRDARHAGKTPASAATMASRAAATRIATGSAKPKPNIMLRTK